MLTKVTQSQLFIFLSSSFSTYRSAKPESRQTRGGRSLCRWICKSDKKWNQPEPGLEPGSNSALHVVKRTDVEHVKHSNLDTCIPLVDIDIYTVYLHIYTVYLYIFKPGRSHCGKLDRQNLLKIGRSAQNEKSHPFPCRVTSWIFFCRNDISILRRKVILPHARTRTVRPGWERRAKGSPSHRATASSW